MREQREREADDDARGDADRRELEAERQSPPQPPEVAPDGSEVEVVAHEPSGASHGRESGHPQRPLLAEEFLVGLVVDPVFVAVHGDVEAGVHK